MAGRTTTTYQLSSNVNVAQFPYIDAEVLRNHCKISHQDKNRRCLDHAFMLQKKELRD
jgi:hypothetical protein